VRYVILVPVALIVWGAILFPIVTGLYGLIKWRGSWRLAAAVPLLVLLLFAPVLASPPGWWALVFIPLTMLLSAYSGVVALLHRRRQAQ
jgi:hypothetical protein